MNEAPIASTVPETLLAVKGLKVWFRRRRQWAMRPEWVRAVDGVDLTVRRGETLALVGESGCGKTTTGRAIVRIDEATAGQVWLGGQDLLHLHGEQLRKARRRFQMIFQNPYSSLDPRMRIAEIVGEPLDVHGLRKGHERHTRVCDLLQQVGLSPAVMDRYPVEFSGGQRQRIAIARALAAEPEFVVCDEPLSALDVSIQAQTINLLTRLQRELNLSYLLISHDLAIVRQVANRVAVMYLGRIVEDAPAERLYSGAAHPYSLALLSAVPVPDVRVERNRRRIVLEGDPPSPTNPPTGCTFHTRCWLRKELGNPAICASAPPALEPTSSGDAAHSVACHFHSESVVAGRRVLAPLQ